MILINDYRLDSGGSADSFQRRESVKITYDLLISFPGAGPAGNKSKNRQRDKAAGQGLSW
jgi:hypothetical protein